MVFLDVNIKQSTCWIYYVHFRLTAFVAKTLQEARFGEWEKDLFIPIELLNKIALYLCSQQNNVTGEFMDYHSPIYDRNYVSTMILIRTAAMFELPILAQ